MIWVFRRDESGRDGLNDQQQLHIILSHRAKCCDLSLGKIMRMPLAVHPAQLFVVIMCSSRSSCARVPVQAHARFHGHRPTVIRVVMAPAQLAATRTSVILR